jgi:hypothetical protein
LIRPLDRSDLPEVARLYERVVRSGTDSPPPGLAGEFERTVLDHPWADPELPSLVYEDPRAGIVGFLGSHPRRLRLGDRRLRLGCSGQLVAHPDHRGVGALLLRRYLAGPQDLTITDGANETVRSLWERLGGSANELASVGWTRVFRPASAGAGFLAARRGGRRRGGAVLTLLDRAAGRPLAPPRAEASSEPLTPAALLEGLRRLEKPFPLRPDYDGPFLDWLFGELSAVTARGELLARRVSAPDGRDLGWYVAYGGAGGPAQALQVAARPADAGAVLDDLFQRVAELGPPAVQGRLEPQLHAALRGRRCIFNRTEWALVHGGDVETRNALAYGRALLTRLEGEWWTGHHLS